MGLKKIGSEKRPRGVLSYVLRATKKGGVPGCAIVELNGKPCTDASKNNPYSTVHQLVAYLPRLLHAAKR